MNEEIIEPEVEKIEENQEEIVEKEKQVNVMIMIPTFEINGLFN